MQAGFGIMLDSIMRSDKAFGNLKRPQERKKMKVRVCVCVRESE